MEKETHSIETWSALAEVDPLGTFDKLVLTLDLQFHTAQSILTKHEGNHLSACKFILEKYKDVLQPGMDGRTDILRQYSKEPMPHLPPKKNKPIVGILNFIGICILLIFVYAIVRDVAPYLLFSILSSFDAETHDTVTLVTPSPSPLDIYDLTHSARFNSPTPAKKNCLHWSAVTKQMNGQNVCVYGTISRVHANYQAEQSFIYFGTEDQFFVTNEFKWDDLEGCVQVFGTVGLNTYRVPYINTSDFYDCEPWMQ